MSCTGPAPALSPRQHDPDSSGIHRDPLECATVTSWVHRTSGFEEERLRLFTIGDSVSQGFMSVAAGRTDLTYSTLVARSMGLEIGMEYRFPQWAKDGENG